MEQQTTPQRVNILLVDDRPERLLSYEATLSSLGHNLVRAQSGAEALEQLMKLEFAAILMDVSMPDMDGFETASLIRGHPRFEETPIIFITGLQMTELDQRRGYEIGAVDYVQIPVVPDVLRGKVHALVQLYLQRAELTRLNSELTQAHEELKAQNMRELQQLNETLEKANGELLRSNHRLTQEIAERQRVEEELNESARRKDEYIAVLAHELRNPLSAIHNAVQVMALDDASEEQRDWAQELMHRQVTHLTCLMDDLLDVSRISSGRIELRQETVNLNETLTHAADTIGPLLKKHGHSLSLNLPDRQLLVSGDTVRLSQVIGNLLTNAAKYMDDGGAIEVHLEADDQDRATLRVRDQGVGIPTELLDKVFELFVQAPSAINRAEGGLGIGLALVRALVSMHGGTISVHSDGLGSGSEFCVTLPLALEVQEVAPDEPPQVQEAVPELRVLIIDDNADAANGLAMFLESQGYLPHLAHSGKDGLAAALAHRPDLILLDIGLPDIDGYEVAQRVRAEQELNGVSIIAMTGYSGSKARRRAESVGFDDYLVKPIDFQRLLALLTGGTAVHPPTAPESSA